MVSVVQSQYSSFLSHVQRIYNIPIHCHKKIRRKNTTVIISSTSSKIERRANPHIDIKLKKETNIDKPSIGVEKSGREPKNTKKVRIEKKERT